MFHFFCIRSRGVPDIRGYPFFADIRNKIGLKTDIRYPRISNPGQNGYPLSADIKSVDITDIRFKRISVSNPRISADIRRISADFFEDFLDTISL